VENRGTAPKRGLDEDGQARRSMAGDVPTVERLGARKGVCSLGGAAAICRTPVDAQDASLIFGVIAPQVLCWELHLPCWWRPVDAIVAPGGPHPGRRDRALPAFVRDLRADRVCCDRRPAARLPLVILNSEPVSACRFRWGNPWIVATDRGLMTTD
jgi:hypothetical protein